jgi:hypothetical protein
MTTKANPMLDFSDERMAAALYPNTRAEAGSRVAIESEDDRVGRLLYPDGAAPPLKPLIFPEPDTTPLRAEDAELAQAFYGDKTEKPAPAPKVAAPRAAEPAQPPLSEPQGRTVTTEPAGDADKPAFDESAYDTETVASYRAEAKGLGVADDVAQRLLERVAPKLAERQAAQLEAMREQWVEEARADPELNDAMGFEENIATARAVITRFGSAELRELLNTSGLGDHPAMIRFALRVGRRLDRDQ